MRINPTPIKSEDYCFNFATTSLIPLPSPQQKKVIAKPKDRIMTASWLLATTSNPLSTRQGNVGCTEQTWTLFWLFSILFTELHLHNEGGYIRRKSIRLIRWARVATTMSHLKILDSKTLGTITSYSERFIFVNRHSCGNSRIAHSLEIVNIFCKKTWQAQRISLYW